MHNTFVRVLPVALVLCQPLSAAFAVTIETVVVQNPGNVGELSGEAAGGYGPSAIVGAVPYVYHIGKFEVTNSQYAEFLNAKAKSDPLVLYPEYSSSPRCGIERVGPSGNFSYTIRPNMGDKPVVGLDWFDVVRFTNWLQNGQGAGDTESGSYTLAGGEPVPFNATTIQRNAGAKWVLPNDDEWYKSAYYDPTLNGGIGGYWDFAAKSNNVPATALATGVGDVQNPGFNVANYADMADWNGQDGNVTTVGTAGLMSRSFYGTADQNGNIYEWTETPFNLGQYRILRGGSYHSAANTLSAAFRLDTGARNAYSDSGFRVALLVPEPSSLLIIATAILGCLPARPRSRRRNENAMQPRRIVELELAHAA